jgi:hypothetical protein
VYSEQSVIAIKTRENLKVVNQTPGRGLLNVKLGTVVLLEFEKHSPFRYPLSMKTISIHIFEVQKIYKLTANTLNLLASEFDVTKINTFENHLLFQTTLNRFRNVYSLSVII